MKPTKYNGTTPINAYLQQFELCAKYNQWSSEEKSTFLQCSLEQNATNILWEFRASENIPYDTLVEWLKQRFGTQELAEVYRAQLYRRKQLPGETLIDLLFDIHKLISLAYPSQQTTEAIEMMGWDIYIEAISDPDLALRG